MSILQSLLSKFRKPEPVPSRYEVLSADLDREIMEARACHKPVKHLLLERRQLVRDALAGKFRDAMNGGA